MVQTMLLPTPAGRGSVSVTPVAVAVPSLTMLIVKPTAWPAFTVALSTVLVTSTSGALTVIVADELAFCSDGASLLALMVAVLVSDPVNDGVGASANVLVP